MLVCAVGDIVLDVVVRAERALREDDDTPGRIVLRSGGQAANVACWVTYLGGRAMVVGPRTTDSVGTLLQSELAARGVELVGPVLDGSAGTVVSIVADGRRTLVSDPGKVPWADRLADAPDWPDHADWMFLSGYPLLRCAEPERLVRICRAGGHRVAVDLASAELVEAFGATGVVDLLRALAPELVLGTVAEWGALGLDPGRSGWGAVLKQGAGGATFWEDGRPQHRPPAAGPLLDVTGAGDALAAGLLVGGPGLAMQAAAACAATLGAQPGQEPIGGACWQQPAEGEVL